MTGGFGGRAPPRSATDWTWGTPMPVQERRLHCPFVLVVIDVGNTQTVIGVYPTQADGRTHDAELADHWRIATNAERTPDELALMMRQFLDMRDQRFDPE